LLVLENTGNITDFYIYKVWQQPSLGYHFWGKTKFTRFQVFYSMASLW